MSSSNSHFFKIFFFNERCLSTEESESVQTNGFNRPSVREEFKPESEYLIMHVFPKTNRVQIEDSNVKKTLEKRVVGDLGTEGEGSIMSVETQMETLVAQWLKLCRNAM